MSAPLKPGDRAQERVMCVCGHSEVQHYGIGGRCLGDYKLCACLLLHPITPGKGKQ